MIEETLTSLWQLILPWITIGLQVIMAIGTIAISVSRIKNAIKNSDTSKIENNIENKITEKIKHSTFSHDIAPIVESEMIKIKEDAAQILKEEIKAMKSSYIDLLNVLKELAAYFDNSIGVSPEQKALLKSAIKAAQEHALPIKSVESMVQITKTQDHPKTIIER